MASKRLGSIFLDAIKSKHLQDFSAEATELLIDQKLADGIIKEIPLAGWIAKAISAVSNISDALLMKKLFKFFNELKDIPEEIRYEFAQKIRNNSEYREKVGDNLWLIIDKFEHMNKAVMLGKLFRAFIESEIDNEKYGRLASAVQRLNMHDIPFLKEIYRSTSKKRVNYGPNDSEMQGLSSIGLVKMVPDGSLAGDGFYFEKNKLGELFVKIALGS